MKSKWYEYKEKAIQLRKRGLSIRGIEKQLKIPRSTLSGWFKNVNLTQKQKERLNKNWRMGLIRARRKAVLWHNQQKNLRLEQAKKEAMQTLSNINIKDSNILELALALLYIGEGSKKKVETALGSSDPLLLKFFVVALKKMYNVNVKKIRCDLYLRADQNPDAIKRFWAKELKLPLSNFKGINIDKRTINSPTYPTYKGVCNVTGGSVAIQRKLVYLSNIFCNKIIKQYNQ